MLLGVLVLAVPMLNRLKKPFFENIVSCLGVLQCFDMPRRLRVAYVR